MDKKFGVFSPDKIKKYTELTDELYNQYTTIEKKINNFSDNIEHFNKYFAEVKNFIENCDNKFLNF